MKFSHFFIDRPIFAWVLTVLILLIGFVSFFGLPIAQYPEVTPPTIAVTAVYPGANARVVAETVATPIEQEINGVENMLYISSQCTNDGQMTINVTFEVGTDLDMAQVLVQNRVSIAEPKLPEDVRRQGVTTKKKSPSILLTVNLISPDNRYDQTYLSNYALIQIKDELARIPGVGDVSFLGARDYSMRVWLDPDRLAARDMSASDVLNALREQNVQVAAGRIGQPPAPAGQPFQYTLNTKGRLLEPSEFANIVIKTGDRGQLTRLRDVGRVELGAKNYDVSSALDGQPSITIALFQLPGSNALQTAEAIKAKMADLATRFPQGIEHRIVYDTTIFVDESIHEVYKTIFEAFILVFIVVLVFLQDWRATILPMIEVPLCLVGTFFVMSLMGFSLNNLSLFGLVLAIGIVVDDAIVVIENVERWVGLGYDGKEATRRAMDEVTGPVIATALVLCSVFVPTAFLAGISGAFYKQFALTVATATVISAFNAMTLTPARCAQMFGQPTGDGHGEGHAHAKQALPWWGVAALAGLALATFLEPWAANLSFLKMDSNDSPENAGRVPEWAEAWAVWVGLFLIGAVIGALVSKPVIRVLNFFLRGFNKVFDLLTGLYGATITRAVRLSVVMLAIYGGLLGLTYFAFQAAPSGFIPQQDKGYLVANVQLPEGASLERTEKVVAQMAAIARETEGVAHTLEVPGYSLLTSSNIANLGGMFIILEPFEERSGVPALQAPAILTALRQKFATIQDGIVVAFGAPSVEGLGSTGGFKLQVRDRSSRGFDALQAAVQELSGQGNQQPGLVGLFSSFRADQPQLYIDIDRAQAKNQGIPLDNVFNTLQIYLGSAYANDFTFEGRNWQVNVQADQSFRDRLDDIARLKVRNAAGKMVPMGALITVKEVTGPAIVNRYNLYPSAELSGNTLPGVSSGQAISMLDRLSAETLPQGFDHEWTELSLQEILASKDILSKLVFPLAVVFVFLVLAAQYESWSLPMAVILIVPMCLLAALAGVLIRGLDNNIFTQIGLVVLVGLAAKNAILIVEFAKTNVERGQAPLPAVVDAAKLRLRPILMTSFAFILGVLPLVIAQGAGFEMRQALGTAVFSGMLGVTFFGLLFTPIFFYAVTAWLGGVRPTSPPAATSPAEPPPPAEPAGGPPLTAVP